MIDFHSHFLFKFDDGARTEEESLKMLGISREMGVEAVVSTSHCYLKDEKTLEDFLERRERRFETLGGKISEEPARYPEIIRGAEVNITYRVSHLKGLEKLCIENTEYMLVELPYVCTEQTIDEVYNLTLLGIKPVMAHIERYMDQDRALLENLFSLDALYQLSTSVFYNKAFKSDINFLMKNGLFHVIGTDMHNMKKRPPDMDKALKSIRKHYGEDYVEYFEENARNILQNKEIDRAAFRQLKRKSGLAALFG